MSDTNTHPRIALIGCGAWGRHIARNLAAMDCLAGIVDDNATHAKNFDCPQMDFDAAMADLAIDAVAVASPAATHCTIALAALAAGKAVFIEKPFALSMAGAEAMATAAEKSGKPIMVGHLIRHHPVFAELLAMVAAGDIGTLRHIRACRIAPGRIRNTESVVYDLACHDLALIGALTGFAPPQNIKAHGASHITQGIADHVSAQMEFGGGVVATLEAGWYHPVKHHALTVIGDKAALVFDDCKPWPQKLTRHNFMVDDKTLAIDNADGEAIAVAEGEPLRREMENFAHAITGRGAILTGIDEALYVQKIMDAIEAQIT